MGDRLCRLTPDELNKLQKGMAECPFCASKKVKLTSVKNKIQVICNVCHARGPIADTPEKAVSFWTSRKGKMMLDNYRLDKKQLDKFLKGELLLNTRSEFDMMAVINTIEKSGFDIEFTVDKCYVWGLYGDSTVLGMFENHMIDKPLSYEFGYCDIPYARMYNIKIEEPRLIRVVRK